MFFQNNLDYILNSIHARREFTDKYVNSKKQQDYFKNHSNRKSDGSLRWIYEPKTQEHTNIYKSLYEEFKKYQSSLHEAAHGFRVGYSNVTNAKMHLGANHLFNIDIENFYAQIKHADVLSVFIKLGADTETATYLSKLCTINGVLPQGLNTSPDIANHHLQSLDIILTEYAEKQDIIYTRYVDDMSFSSKHQINSSEICKIVEDAGLRLSETKKKYQKRGSNQYVTGLTIFDSEYPRISKKYKKRLRLELHVINKVGINDFVINLNNLPPRPQKEEDLRKWIEIRDEWADKKLIQLKGHIDYVNGVEPHLASKMYPIFNIIIEARKSELEKEKSFPASSDK